MYLFTHLFIELLIELAISAPKEKGVPDADVVLSANTDPRYSVIYVYLSLSLSLYVYIYIYIYMCVRMYNGPDSSVVRAYGLGGGRSWVRSSPCITERVTGQTVQSLWRISSSTSGANSSCESKDSSSLKKEKKCLIYYNIISYNLDNLV